MSSAEQAPHPDHKLQPNGQARHHESRWLSVDQIRKQQRCRRSVVVAAMQSGELPFERRGRIRYARICDIEAWERTRLIKLQKTSPRQIHPDLKEFF